MIDQVIPKQFLEMVPASAEDFKIEIKSDRVLFSGYTKQIIKRQRLFEATNGSNSHNKS